MSNKTWKLISHLSNLLYKYGAETNEIDPLIERKDDYELYQYLCGFDTPNEHTNIIRHEMLTVLEQGGC